MTHFNVITPFQMQEANILLYGARPGPKEFGVRHLKHTTTVGVDRARGAYTVHLVTHKACDCSTLDVIVQHCYIVQEALC